VRRLFNLSYGYRQIAISRPWLFGTGIHASTAQNLICLMKLDTSRKFAIPAHPAYFRLPCRKNGHPCPNRFCGYAII